MIHSEGYVAQLAGYTCSEGRASIAGQKARRRTVLQLQLDVSDGQDVPTPTDVQIILIGGEWYGDVVAQSTSSVVASKHQTPIVLVLTFSSGPTLSQRPSLGRNTPRRNQVIEQ